MVKRTIWLLISLFCLSLFNVGCKSTAADVQNLQLGMTPDEVRDELGDPYTIRAAKVFENEEWTEVWEYLPPIITLYPKTFWVMFENGQLVQWGEPGDFATSQALQSSQRVAVKEYKEQKAER